MTQYLLNIDSTYRDRKLYPLSTEYGVIVNPTPAATSATNIYSVNNIIYSKFRWNGTTTTTILNDTVVGNMSDFSSSIIMLDPANHSANLNYYQGCTFILNNSGVGSVISYYDPNQNSVTLRDPIPTNFYDPTQLGYKIVNPSYNYGNEMLLLGSNLYVNLSNDNIYNLSFLKSGPTNDLFVQNVTQNWILPIDRILTSSRIVTFATPMPSYSSGDLFQVRANGNILVYVTIASSSSHSIQDHLVTTRGSGYVVGDIVTILSTTATTQATYRVRRVDAQGGIVEILLLNPGAGYVAGLYEMESTSGNHSAIMLVAAVAPSIEVNGTPPEGHYILYVPSILSLSNAFFNVLTTEQEFIFYVESTPPTLIATNEPVELMSYRSQSVGVRMPLVSYKQPVCYDVRLINLILPNQPVYGYNVLPTFFPFLLLEFYNTSIPGSNAGILYSNNPNTERVTFFCPVGNPRNPLTVSYLIVRSSSQAQTIKWVPTDNFFFRVLLPNGETLRYNFDLDPNETDIIRSNLTTLATTSNFRFWGQMTDRRISATFSFNLKN